MSGIKALSSVVGRRVAAFQRSLTRPRDSCRAALMLLATCAPAAFAAAPGADAGAAPGATDHNVVVTASRNAEDAFVALAPVLVIGRDELERSLAVDVADVLRLHAGIDVVRAGGPGQQTSLFIRGTDSNHTAVLIDGVRVNSGSFGGAAMQNFAPELVDHIEVVKGPRSTLYGTDAIGGVINVITRSPGGTGLDALAGYGRYDTREGALAGWYGGDAGALSATVNWAESAGFPTQVGDPADRGYRNLSTALAAHTELNGVALGARFWQARGNTQYSDLYATPVGQNEDFRDSALAFDAALRLGERLRTRVLLSQAIDDLQQRATPGYATTRRNSLDWQNGLDLGAQQLTFGGLLSRENTRASDFGLPFDVTTRSDNWYVEDRATQGRHRLLAAVGYTRNDAFGDHATWNAEYGYALTPATLLTAGFGSAFHAPDGADRFGYAGNPALRPETARNLELGLRQRIAAHQTLSLTAFENRVDELIQYVPMPTVDNPYNGLLENVARARIRGLEAIWDYLDTDWRAHLEASRQEPVNRVDGSRLLRRARASGALSLARRLGVQEFGVDVYASGNRADIDSVSFASVVDGGYTLVNLSWRAALGRGLTLQLRLDNALDRRYALASGYNTPRRGLAGALRYAFR